MKPGPWFALSATDSTGPVTGGTIQNGPFMESREETLASSVGGGCGSLSGLWERAGRENQERQPTAVLVSSTTCLQTLLQVRGTLTLASHQLVVESRRETPNADGPKVQACAHYEGLFLPLNCL